ncbi:MAG: FAD:protein FMN transferase [Rhodobacteraceae bacterium]|jgi:thiamine biosynthesis lipoprotein|nr:FAD:protein FMN transferase [Paracoccaceae bacterium]
MPRVTRRRFLTIAAAAALAGPAAAAPVSRWRGVALGAAASITLAHPQADSLIAMARAEISRLEGVFSLYRPDSALMRLNAGGSLAAPPFELVECLGIAGAVHRATGGAFDPTVQPLWAVHAEAWAEGAAPSAAAVDAALARTGWVGVASAPDRIAFVRPGMALTLNGIAQGYIADRVARLLGDAGVEDVLVDTGETVAAGHDPSGQPWRAILSDRQEVRLADEALATSAPLGTVFDAAGTAGHIIDPLTGWPAAPRWRHVTVAARSAALADALSTAACLLDREAASVAAAHFPDARIVAMG